MQEGLARGQQMPFFEVVTLDGTRVAYRDVWQQRHLLLVCIPDAPSWAGYRSALAARETELTAHDTALVITAEAVPGLPLGSLVTADRWGEIHDMAVADRPGGLPGPDELVEWLRYIQHQCPECQGESR